MQATKSLDLGSQQQLLLPLGQWRRNVGLKKGGLLI